MPIRRLPRTDEERASALNMAKKRKEEVSATEVPMSASTISRLDAAQLEFQLHLQERGNALSAQSKATAAAEPLRAKARMYISHFFQVFNLGVTRELFPAAHRGFYQLDMNCEAVPVLDSAENITRWGQRIIEGDAARVAAGGAAMALPSAAEVQTVFEAYLAASVTQAERKAAYDIAQECVATMRPDIDSLIVRMWNEIEAAYSEEGASSKRRKARQWGVVYISSPGEGTVREGILDGGKHRNLFRNLDAEADITVRNTGTASLLFYRATAARQGPVPTGYTVMPGEGLTLPFSEFGMTGGFLNLANQTALLGSYMAKVEGG